MCDFVCETMSIQSCRPIGQLNSIWWLLTDILGMVWKSLLYKVYVTTVKHVLRGHSKKTKNWFSRPIIV